MYTAVKILFVYNEVTILNSVLW